MSEFLNFLSKLGSDLLNGLLINFVLAVFFFSITFIALTRNKRSLFRCFGITNEHPDIIIYTSRIEVQPQGTKAFQEITQGSINTAINALELKAAVHLRDLFKSSVLTKLPNSLQEFFQSFDIQLAIIDPQIQYSPLDRDAIEAYKNVILLGNGIYNLVTEHYLGFNSSYFAFQRRRNQRVIKIKKGKKYKGQEEYIMGRSKNKSKSRETAIIQRLKDIEHGTVIFICAGVSSASSYSAGSYLAKNWKKLYKKYGDKEYGIVLALDSTNGEQEPENPPEIIKIIVEGKILSHKKF